MNISKTRKTMRVLYLYLTIPLLLVTMFLVAIALMSATKKPAATPEMAAPADAGTDSTKASDTSHKVHRPSVEVVQSQAKEEKPSDTTAGQTAIITAIMTGITGLLGAIVQVVIAFMKMQEKRKSEREA